MAAKSYLICLARRFKKDEFLVPMQQTLLEDEGTAETKLSLTNANFHENFSQYICQHDFRQNKSGYVRNQHFNYYFERLKFYTYYNEDLSLVLVQTRSEAAINFINKLNLTKHYDLTPVTMNFHKMIPLITEIGGAWIADLKRAHLKTAGFFGPNVHKSEEYKEAAAEGNVSSIRMTYISEKSKEEYTVQLSSKGSIVIYENMPTIEDELDLVYEIYQKLISPHQ